GLDCPDIVAEAEAGGQLVAAQGGRVRPEQRLDRAGGGAFAGGVRTKNDVDIRAEVVDGEAGVDSRRLSDLDALEGERGVVAGCHQATPSVSMPRWRISASRVA